MDTPWPELLRPFLNPVPYQGNGSIAAFIHPAMGRDESLLSDFDVEGAANMEYLVENLKTAAGR